jgi:hypothetical protein
VRRFLCDQHWLFGSLGGLILAGAVTAIPGQRYRPAQTQHQLCAPTPGWECELAVILREKHVHLSAAGEDPLGDAYPDMAVR